MWVIFVIVMGIKIPGVSWYVGKLSTFRMIDTNKIVHGLLAVGQFAVGQFTVKKYASFS